MTRIESIKQSGVDAAKYPFASFCYGRGWKGHKTAELARKSADRDARKVQRAAGGGLPQTAVAESATGKSV